MHILNSIILGLLGGMVGSGLANFVLFRIRYAKSRDREELIKSWFCALLAFVGVLLVTLYIILQMAFTQVPA